MNQLKTLKDIILVYPEDTPKEIAMKYAIQNEIREETINWVKLCKSTISLENWSPKNLLDFWMERLNITEEDLKEEKNK